MFNQLKKSGGLLSNISSQNDRRQQYLLKVRRLQQHQKFHQQKQAKLQQQKQAKLQQQKQAKLQQQKQAKLQQQKQAKLQQLQKQKLQKQKLQKQKLLDVAVFEKIVIVANKVGQKLGIANNIKKHIKQTIKTVDVEIITEFPFENKDNYLYIFLYFHNIFDVDKYPRHYIVWQIEQLTSKDQKAWRMTQDKINVFNNAINIFEISMKNYNNIYDSNISRKKILYNPIPFYNEKNNILFDEKNIDCVFFGAANNRRMTINKYLKKELDKHGITFKILYGVYDKELTDILEKTKYVINLHYYDKPCLEGARINIAIENNCVTISEDVFDDEYTKELYKDYVIYNPCVKEDLSNIDIFINSIIHNLKPEIYKKNISNFNKEKLSVKFENLLKKNLLSCVYIKNSKLDITSTFDIHDIKYFKKNFFCLHLIENNINRTKIHLSNILPNDFTYYYANKYVIGYIGAGASFYNLIYNAKKFNLENITIFEDDCKFNSDFEKQYKIIKEFLNIYKDWDIFNGFVCHIMTKKKFAIKKIYSYKGITFLHINEMVGMVFNIYNKKSYDIILNNWNTEKFIQQHLLNGGNISNNYIDQILNKKANNIIITIPYLFDIHQVNSEVDLANGARNIDFEYKWYQKKLKETYRYLNNKINEYLINNKVINL
jgi:hypothetical protein